jgi:hypothetical protein
VKKLAAQATEGGMEKVQPVIAATLADVDRRLVSHEDRIGNIATKLVDQAGGKVQATVEQVDRSLEARITQVQSAATAVTDQALDHVDQIAPRPPGAGGRDRQQDHQGGSARRGRRCSIAPTRSCASARPTWGGWSTTPSAAPDQALAARIDQIDEVAGAAAGQRRRHRQPPAQSPSSAPSSRSRCWWAWWCSSSSC